MAATPLFAVLILVETSDALFALDSIAAILGITTKEFVIFTSNAFAILGMRALYFFLEGAAERFHYLAHGLSIIMVFIGMKLLLTDVYEMPVWASLSVIAFILGGATWASFRRDKAPRQRAKQRT